MRSNKTNFLFKKGRLLGIASIAGFLTTAFQPTQLAASPRDPFLTPQGKTVRGKITDDKGAALSGVSVMIKGTTRGTTTKEDGSFSIDVPDNKAVLEFSYTGFQTISVSASSQNLEISLKPAAGKLDDVVVVGYGTQKRTSVTAAVSTIKASDVAQKPVVNLSNSLVGRASGLIITQSSGEPGYDGSSISIRGVSTLSGNTTPLVIVDGVPRDFSRLDPNTVESFTILKDAAAVAPYGVAGANGVILVTTKKGKIGAPSLNYNGYVGIQNPTKVPTFVNSYQYALMRNEANKNDGLAPAYTDADLQKFLDHSDPDGHSDGHPLQDIIMPNRIITSHNLSLSGGADRIRYFAGIQYTSQQGMWSPTYLKKYNAMFNITADATRTTKVGLSVNGWVEDQHFPSQSAATIIGQAQRQAPTTPVYYSNGLWSGYIGQSLIGEIYHSGYQFNENPSYQTQFSIEQQLPFVKGLSLKAVVSYDPSSSMQRKYTTPIPFYNVDTTTNPYTYKEGIQGNSKASFWEYYNQTHAFTYQGYINYHNTFGKHDITALAVVENRIVKYEEFSAQRLNYSLDIDELNYGGSGSSDISNSGYSTLTKQLGYVYRLAYAYNNRYLLEASGRYDGSYVFGPGHRFGFFPAFSAGWRLSEESFIKDHIKWIDNLKLRGSWGESGALPYYIGTTTVADFNYLSTYGLYSNSAVLDGNITQGLSATRQGNPDITWEKAQKTDIGLEGSILHGLFGFEIDYFYEKRSNMLLDTANHLPAEYGLSVGQVNAGIMSNHGIDITLRSAHSFSKDLRLDITGTFTYARNKLLRFYETGATYNNPNRRETGRSLNTQYGLKALGYYSDADFNADGSLKSGEPVPTFGPVHPGDIKYADLANSDGALKPDGVIDANDQTVIGHPQTPEIIYGLEPHLTWKSFDLDILFQGSANSDIYLNSYFVQPFNASGSASELSFSQYWTPDRTNVLYPRLTGTPSPNNTQTSSWWVRNDSYLRLKSFELGYTLPAGMIRSLRIQGIRIYIAGQNIINWTPHMKEIIDPENSGSNQNYYQQRVFSFGANVTF